MTSTTDAVKHKLGLAVEVGLQESGFTVEVACISNLGESSLTVSADQDLWGVLGLRSGRPLLRVGQAEILSNANLPPGGVCRLAWRYDPERKMHALFVNGELDAEGEDRDTWPKKGQVAVQGSVEKVAVWTGALSNERLRVAWIPPADPFLGSAEVEETADGIDFSKARKKEVLRLVNKSDRKALQASGLNKRAVRNIVKARPFTTVEDLSSVPQVGQAALRRLRGHVCGLMFTEAQALATLSAAHEADEAALKKGAKVNARALKGILKARAQGAQIDSLDALLEIPYVGRAVLERLQTWAPEHQGGGPRVWSLDGESSQEGQEEPPPEQEEEEWLLGAEDLQEVDALIEAIAPEAFGESDETLEPASGAPVEPVEQDEPAESIDPVESDEPVAIVGLSEAELLEEAPPELPDSVATVDMPDPAPKRADPMQAALRAQLFASLDAAADIIPLAVPELGSLDQVESIDVRFVATLIASLLRRGGLYLEGQRFSALPRRVSQGLVLSAVMEAEQRLTLQALTPLVSRTNLQLPSFPVSFSSASLIADTAADKLYFQAESQTSVPGLSAAGSAIEGLKAELWRAPPGEARLELTAKMRLGAGEEPAMVRVLQREGRCAVVGALPFVRLGALLEALLGPVDGWWPNSQETEVREIVWSSGVFDLRFTYWPEEGRFEAAAASDDFERIDIIALASTEDEPQPQAMIVLSPAEELAPSGIPLKEAYAVLCSRAVQLSEVPGLTELLGHPDDRRLGEYQVFGEVTLSETAQIVLGRSRLQFVTSQRDALPLPAIALAQGVVLQHVRLKGRKPEIQGEVQLDLGSLIRLSGGFVPVDEGAEFKASLESVRPALGLEQVELVGLFVKLRMQRSGGSTLALTGWLQIGALTGAIQCEVALSQLANKGALVERLEAQIVCGALLEVLEAFGHESLPSSLSSTLQDARLLDVRAKLEEELVFEGMMRLCGHTGYGVMRVHPDGLIELSIPMRAATVGPIRFLGPKDERAQLYLRAEPQGSIQVGVLGRAELYGHSQAGVFALDDQGFDWSLDFDWIKVQVQGRNPWSPTDARIRVECAELDSIQAALEAQRALLHRRVDAESKRLQRLLDRAADRTGKLTGPLKKAVEAALEERSIADSDLRIATRELTDAQARADHLRAEQQHLKARASHRRSMERLRNLEQDAAQSRGRLRELVHEREARERWFAARKPAQQKLERAWYEPQLSALKSVENGASFALALLEQSVTLLRARIQREDPSTQKPQDESAVARALDAARGIAALAQAAAPHRSLESDGRILVALKALPAGEERELKLTIVAVMGGLAELASLLDERQAELESIHIDAPLSASESFVWAKVGVKQEGESRSLQARLRLESRQALAQDLASHLGLPTELAIAKLGAGLLEVCSARLRYAGAQRQASVSRARAERARKEADSSTRAADGAKARAEGASLHRAKARAKESEAKMALSQVKRGASADASLKSAALSKKSAQRIDALVDEAAKKQKDTEYRAATAVAKAKSLQAEAEKDAARLLETEAELQAALESLRS